MFTSRFRALALLAALACGCGASAPEPPKKEGIFGKTTQDIGKFDPNARQAVSDQKIHASEPITAPLVAYGPITEKAVILQIDHAVNLFNASEGRYPKDYDEFMERIIKENNIRLPVLPFGGQYKYDEEKHTIVVVRSIENQEKKEAAE